ncbi:Trypsin-like serine protease with C-terminal PDZ domain OS=Singulisphaera acidiphila (strain ATCC BAA-1392 / DSM 18658 / VKM B-2454 / MOB10) GN=Sinac_4277 PE=4 SV=1 [Gemmataceae bacterium]|nr:Trypsin-like serine protease with C-terminal PDZ domain OS=Singulisphaera acidiphila (strain ATCC BAA-1392 / DSM 18658 / VKM B-2454 / MOB10) GN=Sinac_4277 PE=4 SV=1 [Gemmataceae bacterium]VTT96843.1 Trypsin-like serine protease with C-terminal PDZ domain OS=Singulisphaera acidiphila (strain ATCC BAA-1392 / DSM 18658 / VKM B-2454 / MOB10) GN=Sinac_4277 PE=4 SV=1 [Gemmataceae bacterium]
MAVPIARCPGCNAKLASKNGLRPGKSVRCPKCGTRFAIPEPALAHAAAAAPPAAPATPAPVALLSLDDDTPPPPVRRKGRVRLAIACVVLVAVGAGGFLVYERKQRDAGAAHASIEQPAEQAPPKEEPPPPPEDLDRPIDAPDAPPFPGVFPRRLLFVSVTKYTFLNPLTAGPLPGPDRTRAAALALATHWKVPADKPHDQVYVLSDTAPPPDARPGTREVVRGSVERFLATSRAQDHVAIYFGGHAVEIGGKAYFAPADGEHDDPATLVAVDEIYAHLRACKAAQKVVIWDVCRFNAQRGRLRPGSEPMSAGLAAALAAAPADVEVMLTCQPGENAAEVFSAPTDSGTFSGSAFLEAFRLTGEKPPKPRRNAQPTDPIMTAAWASVVTKRLGELGGGSQTVKVTGAPRATAFPFDAAEPLPPRFALPEPAKKPPAPVPSAEVAALVAEFAVPPLKTFGLATPPPEFPDRAAALRDYKADVPVDDVLKNRAKYPFRAAVLDALGDVRSLWKVVPKGGGLRVRESFTGEVSNTLKRDIKLDQNTLAIGIAALEAHNDRLDALQKDRAAQPKRWQAHFDYARAVVKSRLAYLNEYNLMLGNVLTETLPARDAKAREDGYRLASTDTAKMKSKKDVKQLATEAAELFDRIAAERRGTPWGDQARRDRLVPYGMAWQAFASKP